MSLSSYARRRGVALSSVQYQISRGVIMRGRDGLIDVEAADHAWQPKTRSSSEQTSRKQRADLTTAIVRFNLAKVELEHQQAKVIERSLATEVVLGEVDEILQALEATPQRYAGILSGLIDRDQATAEAVLQRVVDTALGELGDLRLEAQQRIDRL